MRFKVEALLDWRGRHKGRLARPLESVRPMFQNLVSRYSERRRIHIGRGKKIDDNGDRVILDMFKKDGIRVLFGSAFHCPASDAGYFPILVHALRNSTKSPRSFEKCEKGTQLKKGSGGARSTHLPGVPCLSHGVNGGSDFKVSRL